MTIDGSRLELSDENFDTISRLAYQICGIKLPPGKENLIKARLSKRLLGLDLKNFEAYLKYVKSDSSGKERLKMLDALTTNKTHFFRESQHFHFIEQNIIPQLTSSPTLKIWSAGCSSGEEPYSLAMLLREKMPSRDFSRIRILATDISTAVLEKAKGHLYETQELLGLPANFVSKYFQPVKQETGVAYWLENKITSLVKFARLNLMTPWPMQGPFDMIFCRNVMIYFDRNTQEELVNRFYKLLAPGGYLFMGHAESITGLSHHFHYVQPAIYQKEKLP